MCTNIGLHHLLFGDQDNIPLHPASFHYLGEGIMSATLSKVKTVHHALYTSPICRTMIKGESTNVIEASACQLFWPNNNMFWVSRREYLQRQWTKSSWPLGLMTRQLCGSSVHGMGRFCALRPLPTPYWLQPTRTDCRSCYLKAVSLHAFINWYPASM